MVAGIDDMNKSVSACGAGRWKNNVVHIICRGGTIGTEITMYLHTCHSIHRYLYITSTYVLDKLLGLIGVN